MEIRLKEEEILSEPVTISVSELLKYENMMGILINFIHTAIVKGMKSVYMTDDMCDYLKNAVLGAIKEFTQPNPSVKTIRRAIDGRYIITIKYIVSYPDNKVEFTIQKVSAE